MSETYKGLLAEMLYVIELAERNDKGRPFDEVWADVLKVATSIRDKSLVLHEGEGVH